MLSPGHAVLQCIAKAGLQGLSDALEGELRSPLRKDDFLKKGTRLPLRKDDSLKKGTSFPSLGWFKA